MSVLVQSVPEGATASPTALLRPQDVASAWRHLAEPWHSAVSTAAHSEPLHKPGEVRKSPQGSLGQRLSPMVPPPYVPHQQYKKAVRNRRGKEEEGWGELQQAGAFSGMSGI